MALDIAELFLGSALVTLAPYAVVAAWVRFGPDLPDPGINRAPKAK